MVERGIPGKSDTPDLVKREVIRSEEFPTDPEERLAAVLAGFANSEAKAITLLLLRKGPKDQSELWRDFIGVTDGRWRLGHSTPKAYCHWSLVPIGMVAEELFLSMGALEWTVGYTVTEAGKHYGQPIAAFLLRKAIEYGHSFYPVFGPTNSPGTSRIPLRRAKILEAIVRSSNALRTTDFEDLVSLKKHVVGGHLRALDKAGLIRYTSIDTEKAGYARYQWRPETDPNNVERVKHYSRLTPKVAQVLALEERPMSREDVQSALQNLSPGKTYAEATISRILCGLHTQGLVDAQFQGGKKQSEIELLKKGKRVYQEVLLPIKDALNDGPALREMRNFLSNWPSFAPEAASLYKEASPQIRKEPSSVWQKRILSLLTFHSQGLRPNEIYEELRSVASSPSQISNHLRHLHKQGLLAKRKEGRAVCYYLPTPPQSS
jgi:DNA-binding PadR family transcriptional regulator